MREISNIKFGLVSSEDVKDIAVKKITRSEVYDADGYPVEGGVMDPHLGVIDPGMVCSTCGGRMRDCKGHFGYIELARPVVHVLYSKKIRNLLRFTCVDCKSPLIKDEDKSLRKSNRKTTCPECGKEQPKVTIEKPYTYYVDGDKITPVEIREWLSEISDEVAATLGVEGSRPENLVLERIFVPPVTIRPSITLETGERSEDDLTHKLVDILRINQRLRNNIDIEAPEFIIDDLWELLQYHVSTMFDNSLSGVPPARHRSGRSLKSLIARLKGKEGRFRKNLIGKRANYSARTVISPDPRIDINEVGVPRRIAKTLTIPVRVLEENYEEAVQWVKNGPDKHPGANYVFMPDGSRKRVNENNKKDIIRGLGEGWTVERHLMNGDIVLFNRQPSLHRMSMMAHEVKVLPGKTFRLNLAVCAPYNADFDGDEMNLHVPQTEEGRAEADELLKVQRHIKSPKFGGPIIGHIQDHISGQFLLSQRDDLSREEAFELLTRTGDTDFTLPDEDEIDGRDLISQFIPEGVSFEAKNYDGSKFKVEDGEIMAGIIDKKIVGPDDGELINQILIQTGEEEAVRFLNRVSRLGIAYLDLKGFSVSTSDLEVPESAKIEIKDTIAEGVEEANEYAKQYEQGELEAAEGKTIEQTLETKMNKRLREISNQVEKIVKNNKRENAASVMAESGARGSVTNLALMQGLLGQETIRGKRISRGFKQRTTAHFKSGSRRAKARGFVASSISKGLDPIESFYEIMSQREGLMDSSLRTRTSGYMYRRISNAMQDLRVEYDQTVRDSEGSIIQFRAGEDGIDPMKSDRGVLAREKES